MAVSSRFLLSDGQDGPAVAFKRTLAMRKLVWCSQAFLTKHSELHLIMMAKAVPPDCGWQWAESKAKFLEQAAKRVAVGRGTEVLAFLSVGEMDKEEPDMFVVCCD